MPMWLANGIRDSGYMITGMASGLFAARMDGSIPPPSIIAAILACGVLGVVAGHWGRNSNSD